MDAIFSADLAAASGEQLDKALATILVAFEGMVQVSRSSCLPW